MIGKYDEKGNVIANYHCKRLGRKYKIDEKIIIAQKYLFSDEMLRKRRQKYEDEIPEEILAANVGPFYFDIRVYDIYFLS